jgi:hypothetical protein
LIEVFGERPDVLHHRGQCHALPGILRVSNSFTHFLGVLVARLQKGTLKQPLGDAD